MKFKNLITLIFIALFVFVVLYGWGELNKSNKKFNEISRELASKDQIIEKYDAEKLKLSRDKQIISNRLDDTVKENKRLMDVLEAKPKEKIRWKTKIVEVIKYEKLEDCQIDLNLCIEQNKKLSFDVTEYMELSKQLDSHNNLLIDSLKEKDKVLIDERKFYKKKIKKKNLQMIGLGVLSLVVIALR